MIPPPPYMVSDSLQSQETKSWPETILTYWGIRQLPFNDTLKTFQIALSSTNSIVSIDVFNKQPLMVRLIHFFFFWVWKTACAQQGCIYCVLRSFSCQWLLSCIYREKLRAKFGLPAEPCHDCCVHFCCEPCALCQEHAELKARGFDPSKGWIFFLCFIS